MIVAIENRLELLFMQDLLLTQHNKNFIKLAFLLIRSKLIISRMIYVVPMSLKPMYMIKT